MFPLHNYARIRLTLDDEEDEDLLVPEKRLNLLMASPSITRRISSMMPKIECNSNNEFAGDGFAKLTRVENKHSDNDEDEEVPLLSIPMLMLRRASFYFFWF
jgi:hypothetical protein